MGEGFTLGNGDWAIRRAHRQDLEALVELASLLWPGNDEAELKSEMGGALARDDEVVFICLCGGRPSGFAHCSLRHDYVEGAERSPTAYLEGIFVVPGHRGEGMASGLLNYCESWAAGMGCIEIASDCELGNHESERFHLKSGFFEANRVVCFIKKLKAQSD